ncbi:MAG: DUF1844 domain-containing protein [candidate division Zixibacteria bacterium]|nr:DUF1844 domain-containing protein [candidate division Zixibacteria bacterium]
MGNETSDYFVQLIASLAGAALQQMGKMANPATGEVEKNLEQAKYSIEMLRMIQVKTEGNLSDEEIKALEGAIYDLQMQYVKESGEENKGK